VVNVVCRIILKVAAREGAVIPLRFIEHWMCGAMPFSSTSQFSIGPPRRRYLRQAAPA
jgi:hypothetical protein